MDPNHALFQLLTDKKTGIIAGLCEHFHEFRNFASIPPSLSGKIQFLGTIMLSCPKDICQIQMFIGATHAKMSINLDFLRATAGLFWGEIQQGVLQRSSPGTRQCQKHDDGESDLRAKVLGIHTITRQSHPTLEIYRRKSALPDGDTCRLSEGGAHTEEFLFREWADVRKMIKGRYNVFSTHHAKNRRRKSSSPENPENIVLLIFHAISRIPILSKR